MKAPKITQKYLWTNCSILVYHFLPQHFLPVHTHAHTHTHTHTHNLNFFFVSLTHTHTRWHVSSDVPPGDAVEKVGGKAAGGPWGLVFYVCAISFVSGSRSARVCVYSCLLLVFCLWKHQRNVNVMYVFVSICTYAVCSSYGAPGRRVSTCPAELRMCKCKYAYDFQVRVCVCVCVGRHHMLTPVWTCMKW